MAEKMIKHRLFTWFEEVPSKVVKGEMGLVERIAHHGEVVDITNDEYLARGEELDSFYSDADRKAIEDGTYRGFDAEAVYRMRAGQRPVNPIEPADGEGPQIQSLDAEELAEYIKENNLNVDATVALVGNDPTLEDIEKVLDAESIATDNDPRKGVTHALEAKMAAVTAAG